MSNQFARLWTYIIRLFVEFGYDVKAKGHKILQPVRIVAVLAFFHDFSLFLPLGTLRMTEKPLTAQLLDHGADINQTNENRDDEGFYRHTGWHDFSLKVLNVIATNGDDIQLFDHLISRGANPHRSMALHRASKCQDPGKSIVMIDYLLDEQRKPRVGRCDWWSRIV